MHYPISRKRFATGGTDGDPRGAAIAGKDGTPDGGGVGSGRTNASACNQRARTFLELDNQWSFANALKFIADKSKATMFIQAFFEKLSKMYFAIWTRLGFMPLGR